MSKILVTGGTGYIGSHTVVELQNQGYEVLIADNLMNSDIKVLDGIENITGKKPVFEKIDLRQKPKVHQLFEKYDDISAIIHFAAFKAVGESVEKPLMYYENNLISLINLLETAQKNKNCNQFVFSSSCTVYGQPDKLPVTEQAPVKKAESPYGNTKQISEDILTDFIKANKNFNAISLRYFNPIGAHESTEIGELPVGIPNNLVPFITQTAIGKRKQLKVFGNDFDTPDVFGIRDYIHVVDLAKAHVKALDRLEKKENKENFEIFNLGTGKGSSVMEVIKAFEKVSRQKLNYKITGRRSGDIDKVWADTSLANKELHWKTEKSLEEGLSSAWKWEKRIAENKN